MANHQQQRLHLLLQGIEIHRTALDLDQVLFIIGFPLVALNLLCRHCKFGFCLSDKNTSCNEHRKKYLN